MKRMDYKPIVMAAAIISALTFAGCDEERFIDEPGNLVAKTVDEDLTLPSITVNGAMLHAEAFGNPDSILIVCIHGGPGSDYRYMLNCKDLADHGYRVVFYDQRGSGLSQRFSKESYTDLGTGALDLMYDELSGVIAHYRTSPTQKVFLIGHSWGAMLATAYTGKYPDSVQGLVVCEPGGLKWEDVMEFVSNSRAFNLFGETLNDATYLDQFITGKENDHEILDYKASMLASKNDITGDDNTEPGSSWRSGAVINRALFEVGEEYSPDFSEGISNFNTTVLFFYSEKDKAYPDSWAQKISSSYDSVDVSKIAGVGHDGIIKDKTAWTNQTLPIILDYFDSLR
jgi:proline iminopeptidase